MCSASVFMGPMSVRTAEDALSGLSRSKVLKCDGKFPTDGVPGQLRLLRLMKLREGVWLGQEDS